MEKEREKEKALSFIEYQPQNGFVLTEESQSFLQSLGDIELGVICVVGKYRTGKSFFLNRVLLERGGQGFKVGPTINPCTKGLWLWNRTIKNQQGLDCLVLDAEGFGGLDEDHNHDNRIFLFALLISSYFIYNSQGSIDENALNNLQLIINLAQQLKEKDQASLPSFLWVVRDFVLKIVDTSGNRMTSKEYLEKALEPLKGNKNEQQDIKNKTRGQIKQFFQCRDCITLIRPVEQEQDLQNLSNLTNDKLRGQFVEQMTACRQKVLSQVKVKKINDKGINGSILIDICKTYIDMVNRGAVPNMQNAWDYLCSQQNSRALQLALDEIDQQMSGYKQSLIGDDREFKSIKDKVKRASIRVFRDKAIYDDDKNNHHSQSNPFIQQIQDKLNNQMSTLKDNNKNQLDEFLEKLSKEKLQLIYDRLYAYEYTTRETFDQDVQEFIDSMSHQLLDVFGSQTQREQYIDTQLRRVKLLFNEQFTKKLESENQQQVQSLQQQLQQLQSHLAKKKEEYDKKLFKIGDLEKQNALLKTQVNKQQQQINEQQLFQQGENKKNSIQVEELIQKYQAQILKAEQEAYDAKESLAQKSQEVFRLNLQQEKQIALHSQEIEFNKQKLIKQKSQLEDTNIVRNSLDKDLQQFQQQVEVLKKKVRLGDENREKEMAMMVQQQELLQNTQLQEKQRETSKNDWLLDKQNLQNQIRFLQNQMGENKCLNSGLLTALQQGLVSNNESNMQQLLESNKNLQQSVHKMGQVNKRQDVKLAKYKNYKRVYTHIDSGVCSACKQNIQVQTLLTHFINCRAKNNQIREETPGGRYQAVAQVSILGSFVRQDSSGTPFIEYIIDVNTSDHNKKLLNKKLQDVTSLYRNLGADHAGFELFMQKPMEFDQMSVNQSVYVVQSYLRSVLNNPRLTNNILLSVFMNQFQAQESDQPFALNPDESFILNQSSEKSLLNSFIDNPPTMIKRQSNFSNQLSHLNINPQQLSSLKKNRKKQY